jgi:cyclic pyranopterin phosphate synthase
MSGIIESIKTYPAKGEQGIVLAEARLVENSGLEGDFHAIGGLRQLSLLCAEILEKTAESKPAGKGLCFSRFRENITIRGLPPQALRPGLRLAAGEAILEITGETKHCHEECSLYEAGKPCPLAGKSLFARVVKSGVIRIGDSLE